MGMNMMSRQSMRINITNKKGMRINITSRQSMWIKITGRQERNIVSGDMINEEIRTMEAEIYIRDVYLSAALLPYYLECIMHGRNTNCIIALSK